MMNQLDKEINVIRAYGQFDGMDEKDIENKRKTENESNRD